MHPQIYVDIDGIPVSGVFFDRLVSLNIVDREGIQVDTLELVFNDAAPHFASPRRGAVARATILSGSGAGFVGSYVIDRVITVACLTRSPLAGILRICDPI
jgi:phage protein D